MRRWRAAARLDAEVGGAGTVHAGEVEAAHSLDLVEDEEKHRREKNRDLTDGRAAVACCCLHGRGGRQGGHSSRRRGGGRPLA
jgi:hypothetical protein